MGAGQQVSRAATRPNIPTRCDWGNDMYKQILIYCGFALVVIAGIASAATITVNNTGDTGPGDCTATCTLRDAIATATSGDTIVFASTLASPIALTQGELLIATALTSQGPGAAALTVSAQNNSRVFNIAAAATITDLAIADGALTGVNVPNGTGSPGQSVGGACVFVASGIAAVLDRIAIRHCYATGGNGGSGIPGPPGSISPPTPGGNGGSGGSGGAAVGAAITVDGSLSLLNSSVVDAPVTGGAGATGGGGGIGIPPGTSGLGGVGGSAKGGAVFASSSASLRIANSTIAESSGTGGAGGAGGSGATFAPGGAGGDAIGGLLAISSSATLADLEFSTLASGSVTGGAGGTGQIVGQAGFPVGNAINAGSTLNVLSSIVVGAQGDADLCYGSVTAATGSANLSETTNNTTNPSTCNSFSVNATLAQTLKSLDASATPAYMPIWHSPAIDAAANCQDLASQNVTDDQHGTMRPQGLKCDLGAIEADYIFADGFGG